MRAMILAAGLGTRLQPLTALCAKPALPIRGIPVIAHLLTLLARHGVSEVVINLHHLPDTVRAAVERFRPDGLEVQYSQESELLGTGGAIQRVANFLRESDPSLVLAGDMLLDLDLTRAIATHRERGDRYSLLVNERDARQETFGSLGFDDQSSLRRVGQRFDLGAESGRGLFLGVRVVAARCLEAWPGSASHEDLTDWLGPQLRSGARDIRTVSISTQQITWQPIGTPQEYWAANFDPAALSYRDKIAPRADAQVLPRSQLILGRGAKIEAGARLERVVVWPGERVPASLRARDGVFAGGRFVSCVPGADSAQEERG